MLMVAKSPDRIVVVTNDGLIRNCAYASGASAMRVEELVKRLDRTIDQTTQRIRNRSTRKGAPQSKFENKIQIPKQKPEK
jgi:predicted RNA-binding protein with PIN domain